MRSPLLITCIALAPLAACANGEVGSLAGVGGSLGTGAASATASGATTSSNASGTGAGSTSGTSSASSTSGASGGVPTTCAETNNFVGCCDGTGTLYYCSKGGTAPKSKSCAAPQVCGWESANGYYGCTTTASADPSGMYPKDCP